MKYALYVFLGSCSFGVLSTIVKLAYGEGFMPNQVIFAQYVVGWLIMTLLMIKKRVATTKKEKIQLLLAGTMTALTSITYTTSLAYISASLAIILLFQFTWIGMFIEVISTRKLPNRTSVITIAVILFGTALASGIYGSDITWNKFGITLALLSSVSYSLTIFFNGRIAKELQSVTKGYYTVTGALIVILFTYPPTFLTDINLISGLLPYGFLLGIFGIVIPPILFAAGVPKIGTGLATILGSAELPVVILLSMFVLKEHVSLIQWAGVLLILAAIIMPQLLLQRKRA